MTINTILDKIKCLFSHKLDDFEMSFLEREIKKAIRDYEDAVRVENDCHQDYPIASIDFSGGWHLHQVKREQKIKEFWNDNVDANVLDEPEINPAVPPSKTPSCSACATPITQKVYDWSVRINGKPLCIPCQGELKRK